VDFYDMKGVVEAIATALGAPVGFEPVAHPALLEGRAASVLAQNPHGHPLVVGVVGQLTPSVATAHGLPAQDEVYVAEVDLDALAPLTNLGEDVRVAPLPRHPSIVRDVSVLVGATVPANLLRETIRTAAPPALERLHEFARYAGKGVPEGEVSLSFRLVFRAPERTLTDAEVQQATDGIVAALAAAHGARLR
jgi:phenylalanyl-tRNA synthetase beta chain